jgi:uncharacterized protein HemX
MIKISFPVEQKDIKPMSKTLQKEIARLEFELETAQQQLEMVQKCCPHIGQQTGCNERW